MRVEFNDLLEMLRLNYLETMWVDSLPNPDSKEYTPMELAVIGNALRLLGKEMVSLSKEEATLSLNDNGLLYDDYVVFRNDPSGVTEVEFLHDPFLRKIRHKKEAAVAQEDTPTHHHRSQ